MISLGFAGTPAHARDILEALHQSDAFQVNLVLTQPDRPSKRGMSIQPSPVKQYALSCHLPLYQPATSAELQNIKEMADLDIMVVLAYGMLFTPQALSAPRYGCVNVHFSLLPRWRGASPIQHSIMAGDKESGISLMVMEEALDAGPIINQYRCPVRDDDTTASLTDRLMDITRMKLPEDLEAYSRHPEKTTHQDERLVTYAPRIGKSDSMINWNSTAREIEQLIRAMQPSPLARAVIDDTTLIIRQAAVIDEQEIHGSPGTVINDRDTLDIATGQGILRLITVQPPSRRPMNVRDFLNGRPDLKARLRVIH